MRSYLPAFDLRVPDSLDDALRILAEPDEEWRPFAGGTDLMVLLEAGKLAHTKYVSLWKLEALRGIEITDTDVTLRALTTYTDIRASEVLNLEFPLMGMAARETGGIATQNRGTIGGNIANASPAADTPPALLIYDAEIELLSARGRRRLPYSAFHTGYKTMNLGPGELIAAVRLPRGRHWTRQAYRKVGTRRAQAISKVCFAGAIEMKAGTVMDVRLGFGSVAPTPVRALTAEAVLRQGPLDAHRMAAASAALAHDIAPIDDIRSSSRYRNTVAANLLTAFLEQARTDR